MSVIKNYVQWGYQMNNCKICGFGYALPKRKLTNDEIAQVVDTSDEWIYSRTGIHSRYVAEDENTSDLGARAAEKAILDAGIDKDDIDMILCATFTPDHSTPSTACLIQEKLGMNEMKVMAFDINAACSGFLYALQCAHAYIASGMAKHILVIGSEVISKQLNWEDRGTCIIFGDGAGAVVLSACKENKRMFHYARSQGDVEGIIQADAVMPHPALTPQPFVPTYVTMEGSATFRFAIKAMQESMEDVLKQADVDFSDIDWIIPHQANKRIITNVMKRLKLSEAQVFLNIDEVGNTSAASIPLALGQMHEQGLLKEGMKLVLSGFGAGFTWAGCYLEL